MSVQYTDGSFSETIPFDDAVEEFQDALQQGTARALYVGTENEIEQIKTMKTLKDQIAELSARVDKIEDGPIKSKNVVIPTREEMLKALRGEL
jgi:hypothetical protein